MFRNVVDVGKSTLAKYYHHQRQSVREAERMLYFENHNSLFNHVNCRILAVMADKSCLRMNKISRRWPRLTCRGSSSLSDRELSQQASEYP